MTLYAKSADAAGIRETLLDHSFLVAEVIREMFRRLPGRRVVRGPELLRDLEAAAAVHDIGKAATGFQDMLLQRAPNWKERRHEFLSAAFAAALSLPEEVVLAVMTHHKRIPDSPPFNDPRSRLRFHDSLPEAWEAMRIEFDSNRSAVRELWETLVTKLNRPDLLAGVDESLSGSFLRADWRRARKQRESIPASSRMHAAVIRGLLVSADHIASAHEPLPPLVELNQFKPAFVLRPFQQRTAVEGNVILRAPTGSGKTEAALSWAARNQVENGRLFYTLPYTAALNAMHSRLQREFPNHRGSIGLLHGKAAHHLFKAMQEDYPSEPARAASEARARASLAREMYHPVRVCTPHQLLRFTLRGRGWEQMFTEVPGACVVFDEVHSYDPALAGLVLGTARLFHEMGARLMFVSATLPRFLERIISELVPCQTVAPDKADPVDAQVLGRKRHRVTVIDDTLAAMIPAITHDAVNNCTVLVVCNHVRSAQSMARELRQRLGSNSVQLFHGRFNMRDRQRIEGLLTRPSELPRVLVATQVVEVSLDISYQKGYFEAAPIDALSQRMGRVNRGGLDPPAGITIAVRSLNEHRIYDSGRTERTVDLLREIKEPVSEQALVDICDHVYGTGYEGDEMSTFLERLNHRNFTAFDENLIAGDHEDWIDQAMDGLDHRVDLLPAGLLSEFRQLQSERRWLEADALTVNTYHNPRLNDRISKVQDPWIVDAPYTSADGLDLA